MEDLCLCVGFATFKTLGPERVIIRGEQTKFSGCSLIFDYPGFRIF